MPLLGVLTNLLPAGFPRPQYAYLQTVAYRASDQCFYAITGGSGHDVGTVVNDAWLIKVDTQTWQATTLTQTLNFPRNTNMAGDAVFLPDGKMCVVACQAENSYRPIIIDVDAVTTTPFTSGPSNGNILGFPGNQIKIQFYGYDVYAMGVFGINKINIVDFLASGGTLHATQIMPTGAQGGGVIDQQTGRIFYQGGGGTIWSFDPTVDLYNLKLHAGQSQYTFSHQLYTGTAAKFPMTGGNDSGFFPYNGYLYMMCVVSGTNNTYMYRVDNSLKMDQQLFRYSSYYYQISTRYFKYFPALNKLLGFAGNGDGIYQMI